MTERITILEHGDYVAIYFGNKRIYWYHSPGLEKFCEILDIPCSAETLDTTIVPVDLGFEPPFHLSAYREHQAKLDRIAKQEELEALQKRMRELKAELGKEGAD